MLVPFVDPCLFIERFCSRLDFGTKAKSVENLATRLIQTMNRAWISIGRRPNGLCGAAILIAARVNGFRRSTSQIVRVVHTCEQTIRKRLNEFKATNMAQKTVEEIKALEANGGDRNYDGDEVEEDLEPPIVRKRLREEL